MMNWRIWMVAVGAAEGNMLKFLCFLFVGVMLLGIGSAARAQTGAVVNVCTNLYFSQTQSQPIGISLKTVRNSIAQMLRPEIQISDYQVSGLDLILKADLKFIQKELRKRFHALDKGDQIHFIMAEEIPPVKSFAYARMDLDALSESEMSQVKKIHEIARTSGEQVTIYTIKINFKDGSSVRLPIDTKKLDSEEDFVSIEAKFYNYISNNRIRFQNMSSIQISILSSEADVVVRKPHLLKVIRLLHPITEEQVGIVQRWARRLPRGLQLIIKKMLPNGYSYLWTDQSGPE